MTFIRCGLVLVVALASQMPGPVASQSKATLKARCAQLVAYYDRYGVGRSLNSDGRRNHTRIAAEIDCSRGQYAEGISAMEKLLVAKKFTLPAPGPNVVEDDD